MQRRLQEGYAGVSEVDATRLRLAQAQGDCSSHDADRARPRVAWPGRWVASPENLRAMTLSFAVFEMPAGARCCTFIARRW